MPALEQEAPVVRPGDAPPARRPVGGGRSGGLRAGLRRGLSYAGTPVALVTLLVPVYGLWLGSDFLSLDRRLFDIYQNGPMLVVALGILVCLLSGHFDLSTASLATLVTVSIFYFRVDQGLPFGLVIVIAVAMGLVAGLINGILVAGFKVNAFIATLGTGSAYGGLAAVFTNGSTISGLDNSHPVPHWFSGAESSYGSFVHKAPDLAVGMAVLLVVLGALSALRETSLDWRPALRWTTSALVLAAGAGAGSQLAGRVNWTILALVAMTVLCWIGVRYTRAGRNLAVMGDNVAAARLTNIRVERHTVGAYVAAGLAASIAGVMLASQQGSASAGIADSYLLPAYAAVFLSTVIFSHGRFHPWGAVAGGVAIIFVSQGLVTGGLAFQWSTFVNGVVLILAVSISTAFRRGAN